MLFRQYLNALATTLPLLTSSALASLSPWQVTTVNTFRPSGLPNNSPYSYNKAYITNPDPTQNSTDPNLTQGRVYCELIWLEPDVLYNRVLSCTIVDTDAATHWAWTVELLKGNSTHPDPLSSFDLRWRAVSTSYMPDPPDYVQLWTGTGHFQSGDNLLYSCGGSAVCSASLKPESIPVLVDVASVQCHGTLQEALYGTKC
ncbi:hypothetical protein GGS21DRAFT_527193 [Xylaria nigripes]|nr:hypothetical protein GGS21DRAFT_527193 [Xylaria nigripes]